MTYKGQTFGIATYDALFKYVLDQDDIRPSFFHAFLPGMNITSSKRLDDNPEQYVRHYKFMDQLNDPKERKFLDGMELIQYSIMNAPKNNKNQEQKDWITFFKDSNKMSQADVKAQIKTPEAIEAFDRAKFSAMSQSVRQGYEFEDKEYQRYSDHTQELIEEGREEGMKQGEKQANLKMAKSMLKKLIPETLIFEVANISQEDLDILKTEISNEVK